jgi:beta-phosphoglucomutase-like phosphatase (HAD superfamily)
VIVTGEDVAQGKPDPEPYLLACSRLRLDTSQTIVFEDSNNGTRSAFRAGCNAVMIPDYFPPEDDVKHQAYAIFKTLNEAKALISHH